MKIHEYNEMMSYLTRPAMNIGGRVGFKKAGPVETLKMDYFRHGTRSDDPARLKK